MTFRACVPTTTPGDGLNDVTGGTVGSNERLRGDQCTGEAGRHDTLRLRLGGHRHNRALPAYMPDLLSAPQELVGEDEVVTKSVALCAKIEKVELGVDGNEADRRCLSSSADVPKGHR